MSRVLNISTLIVPFSYLSRCLGECSEGSLTDEEQSLSTALKAWGEIDVSKDPQDARVETLTKIMALAKTAGLMNDDGKLCLCI